MGLRALPRQGRCPFWLALRRITDDLASMDEAPAHSSPLRSLRVEVQVDGVSDPVYWLCHQQLHPRIYFSDQHKSLRVAGVGEADSIRGESALDEAVWAQASSRLVGTRMRYYGGGRFDARAHCAREWAEFGGAVFLLPLWEVQMCEDNTCFLACHLRWAEAADCASEGRDASVLPWKKAVDKALRTAHLLTAQAQPLSASLQAFPTVIRQEDAMSTDEYSKAVAAILEGIEAGSFSKVVLAQQMRLQLDRKVDPVHLLLTLLEKDAAGIANGEEQASDDPAQGSGEGDGGLVIDGCFGEDSSIDCSAWAAKAAASAGEYGRASVAESSTRPRHAYLFLLQLHEDLSFIGCTPEKLFKLDANELTTEAIAGTRRRGSTAQLDHELAQELLHSDKDLREVNAVRDFLLEALGSKCPSLRHGPPFALQLRHVQHICVPFTAKLEDSQCLAQSALGLLHPTPAVCGTPSAAARQTIRDLEPFDRGYYAGPLGYIAADGCEFCVAIRSALVAGDEALVYAGGGIVRGSIFTAEWEEVHNKMKNFISLFPVAPHLLPSASPFYLTPNLNLLHSSLLLEELLRSGIRHVMLSPGSRCAPLTIAVARSQCSHSLCTDERGAAFMALGFARASGCPAAVIVSSGTAVANLLPAVVEASMGHVPLLLLTADRPPELRDTGANQTIHQPHMFGGYVRWFKDVPPPSDASALEPLLADASFAMARATGACSGPVHLNLMFREPLSPQEETWCTAPLDSPRVQEWLNSRKPFTSYLPPYALAPSLPDAQLLPILSLLRGARRGMVVVGALTNESQMLAAAALSSRLCWPMATDVASGLRQPHLNPSTEPAVAVHLLDLMLAHAPLAEAVATDIVLQVGGRITSKRLLGLLRRSSVHVLLEAHGDRSDPEHSVTHRLHGDIASLLAALHQGLQGASLTPNPLMVLPPASSAVEAALRKLMPSISEHAATEPWVASHICKTLTSDQALSTQLPKPPVPPASPTPGHTRPSSSKPSGGNHLLFVSNSMPIRDVNSFCAITPLVLCNRGASGIDGVMHSAIGAALAGRPVTLLIGDLATLHDLNALGTLANQQPKLIVVVLNNAGGGIFRFLPIAGHDDVYSPYFDTPHTHQFEGACRGFGLPYVQTRTCSEFEQEYATALLRPGPGVIEVPTDKEENFVCHRKLTALVSDVLSNVVATMQADPRN